MWSFSAHKMFKSCQRKWYFDEMVANALAKKEPLRREAYVLSKLQGLEGWRGSLVDTVISEHIVRSIAEHRPLGQQASLLIARDLFDRQVTFARAHRIREPNFKVSNHKAEFAAWHAIEYDRVISPDELEKSWLEIQRALENFYQLTDLINVMNSSVRLITQRTLTFKLDKVAVRATPDLVVFRRSEPPLIVDWKTYIKDTRDHRLQLACYALALLTCTPHADFPTKLSHYIPSDIDLLEVQLITRKLRPYKLTEEDSSDVEAFILESATQINLAATASARTEIAPEKYPVAQSPLTCTYCPFVSLCWKE